MPKILVIIATYNGEKRAHKVVNGINKSNIKLDTIIIDNGSTDKTLDILEKNLTGKHIIIKNNNNLGFGGANNIGFKYAIENDYEYVYLLNQDARLFEDTIEKLIELTSKHNDLGIISPFQCGKGLEKVDKNFQCGVCGYESNKDIFSDIYFNKLKDVYEVPRVMAAHRLIPVRILKIIGGFSPTFYHYGEDDNYADRVRYLGYKVYIAPNINVVHDRYNRKDSNSKKIRLGYTYGLSTLSNPNLKRFERFKEFLKVIALNILYTAMFLSLKPIGNLIRLIFSYPKIKKNKTISINGKGPFIF